MKINKKIRIDKSLLITLQVVKNQCCKLFKSVDFSVNFKEINIQKFLFFQVFNKKKFL